MECPPNVHSTILKSGERIVGPVDVHYTIRPAASSTTLSDCLALQYFLIIGVLTVLVFDPFLIHPSYEVKNEPKNENYEPDPLEIFKNEIKNENSTFFGTPAALNSASHCRPHFFLPFLQCYL